MDPVKPVQPYTARPAGTARLERADGSAFKVYYFDIVGRPEREKYEWALSARTKEQALEQLREAGVSGVGVIVLFPHIAKVFFFGECAETVLYAEAYRDDPFAPSALDYARGVEIACAAEMDVAAKEFELWRRSETVEDYLAEFVAPVECGFASHTKLHAYLESRP